MMQCSANNANRIKMFFDFRQKEKNLVKGKKKKKPTKKKPCNFKKAALGKP